MSARPRERPRTGRAAADYHDLQLHRAKQQGKQVLYDGTPRLIEALYVHENEPEMVVYLRDGTGPVRPCELTII